jgi:gas vesicle protein GvpK/gas vesicle protein GvpA/GvpJ/GvpM family
MTAATTTPDHTLPASGAYRSPGRACSLAEVLDRILHLGVSLEGNLTIGVANVDLLYLDLRLLLAAVDTVWPEGRPPVPMAPASSSYGDPAPPPPRPPPAPLAHHSIRPIPAASGEPSAIGAGAGVASAPLAPPPPAPTAGLVRLVLTLVKLLHDLLERQAVRRMDGGHLTATQIDDVGAALLAQAVEIERLRQHFGFSDRELALKFGLSERSV